MGGSMCSGAKFPALMAASGVGSESYYEPDRLYGDVAFALLSTRPG
jgi:hypothetical protein